MKHNRKSARPVPEVLFRPPEMNVIFVRSGKRTLPDGLLAASVPTYISRCVKRCPRHQSSLRIMVFKSWLSLVAVTLLSSAALGQSSAVDTVDPIGAAARRQMSPALLPRQGLRCPIGTVWCPGFTRCAAPGATCCGGYTMSDNH